SPAAVAFADSGRKILVTSQGSDELIFFDAASGREQARLTITGGPAGLAASGNLAFVALPFAQKLSVVDISMRTVVGGVNFPANSIPWHVAVSPDGKTAAVVLKGQQKLALVDIAAASIVGTIDLGLRPEGLNFRPDGVILYATNSGDGNVSVIDVPG